MDDLEQQLKRAFARQEPPPWFEGRVLAAAMERSQPELGWWRRPYSAQRMRWATGLAAALLVTTGVWQHERAVHDREAGEAAKEKVKIALRITTSKLQKIQARVDAISDGGQGIQ